jgi:hypothetical protein
MNLPKIFYFRRAGRSLFQNAILTVAQGEDHLAAKIIRVSLTVYHFRGHDSLSLAVFNGIVLWGAADQTGTGYRVPLAFESDIRSASFLIDSSMENYYNGCFHESIQDW